LVSAAVDSNRPRLEWPVSTVQSLRFECIVRIRFMCYPLQQRRDTRDTSRSRYWTVPLILDRSYLVGKSTSLKIADTKVSGF
jgi:hypothetical protein